MSNYAFPLMAPTAQYFDNAGVPLNGGLLYAYEAGTATPKTTWADAAMQTANDNPVVLDSYGRASIFVRGVYKFVLKDSTGVTLATMDYCYYPTITSATAGLLDDTSAANMRSTLGLGTAAIVDTGTTANKVLKLDSSARIPSVDGSLLTNLAAMTYYSPQYYMCGLAITRTGNASFNVAVGFAQDGTGAQNILLSTAIGKTTGAWAVGDTLGALNTGAVAANTIYHVYLIFRSDTSVTDVVIAAQVPPAITSMPANYNYKRLIGAIKTAVGSTNLISW